MLLKAEKKKQKRPKHTQTLRRQEPMNCLSGFDHVEELALKELIKLFD